MCEGLEEEYVRDGGGDEREVEMKHVCAFSEGGETVDRERGLRRDELGDVAFQSAEEACGERFAGVVHEGGHVEGFYEDGERGVSDVCVLGGAHGCDELGEVGGC